MRSNNQPEVIEKGGFFGKFIAVVLGFLLGVIAAIGGIAGAGFYIYTRLTVKEAVNTASA